MVGFGIRHGLWSRRFGFAALVAAASLCASSAAQAQTAAAAGDTRAGRIAAEQQEKAKDLKPHAPNKAEALLAKVEEQFITGSLNWHPFFQSALAGGGFTLGAGYLTHVGSYNTIDLRGSYTLSGYSRIETEFLAPRLFDRRGSLSILGGWREATQVGFYGTGTGNTSADDRANYSFRQPYVSATLGLRPTRKVLFLAGGAEYSEWDQRSGEGTEPSVDEVYTPETLPGLGAKITYLHTQGTAAIDWRTTAGYTRRGGYYGATYHDFADRDDSLQLPPGGVRGDSARSALPRRLGALAARAGRDHRHGRQRDDPLLHAAGGRRRVEPARLLELAFPRSPQPAPAGRVARAGEQLLRHRHLL